MAWHRWSGGKRRQCGGDGLPEGGNGGGTNKMNGRVLFYSHALHGGNAGLRKERGTEVTARLSAVAERACSHVA
jgi:hypothetical protein